MILFSLLCIGFLSFALTGLIRRYALTRELVDVPNARSSHSVPTPRGGGVAIVICFLISLPALWFFDLLSLNQLLSFFTAGVVVATIGFIDDHGHVAARWRLLAHFLAAVTGLFFIGGLPVIQMFGVELQLGWFGHILALIYLVWMLNLYNFMDGIDGIAGIEVTTVCLGGVLLFWFGVFGPLIEQLTVMILGVASLGFLIWNFPPAKIFMGDAGSGFVGLMLGLFSIAAAHIDQSLFWGWAILLGVFIVDATVTLIRRAISGRAVYEAHRSHAYQYLSRRIGSHKLVSVAVGMINLIWLFPIATLVILGMLDGLVGVLVAYLPLIILAFLSKAGNAEAQKV
jgi:Fuc2NAc and GlcNAc transferase